AGGIGGTVLAGGGRLGGFLVFLGRRLVRFAAVVGLVEAGAFEKHCRPGAEEPAQFLLATLRTLLQPLLTDRLELVEVMVASVALVFVGRHTVGSSHAKPQAAIISPARRRSRARAAVPGRESGNLAPPPAAPCRAAARPTAAASPLRER